MDSTLRNSNLLEHDTNTQYLCNKIIIQYTTHLSNYILFDMRAISKREKEIYAVFGIKLFLSHK